MGILKILSLTLTCIFLIITYFTKDIYWATLTILNWINFNKAENK